MMRLPASNRHSFRDSGGHRLRLRLQHGPTHGPRIICFLSLRCPRCLQWCSFPYVGGVVENVLEALQCAHACGNIATSLKVLDFCGQEPILLEACRTNAGKSPSACGNPSSKTTLRRPWGRGREILFGPYRALLRQGESVADSVMPRHLLGPRPALRHVPP